MKKTVFFLQKFIKIDSDFSGVQESDFFMVNDLLKKKTITLEFSNIIIIIIDYLLYYIYYCIFI